MRSVRVVQRRWGSVDADEINKFAKLTPQWWDREGPMKELHRMNPVRVKWIKDVVVREKGLGSLTEPLRGIKLLDVGCGAGIASEALARLGAQVVGIDANKDAIEVGRLRLKSESSDLAGNLSYECCSAEDLVAEGARFDVVTALEIIEHVSSTDSFIQSLAALTDEGSMLMMSTINKNLLSWALGIAIAEHLARMVPVGTHDWNKFISPEDLTRKLRPDFVVTDIKGMTPMPSFVCEPLLVTNTSQTSCPQHESSRSLEVVLDGTLPVFCSFQYFDLYRTDEIYMSQLLLVIVGDDWPAKEVPTDNPHVQVDSSMPLSTYAEEMSKQLGVSTISDVNLFQGIGVLPNIEQGAAIDMSRSPADEGFASPDLEEGDEQMCLMYAKRVTEGEGETKGEGEADKEAEAGKETEAEAEAEVTKASDFNADEAAKKIFDAIDGLGTNEQAIYDCVDSVQDGRDWDATVEAFKCNHSGCNGGDIIVALQDDLNESEMQILRDKLASKGVTIGEKAPEPKEEATEPAEESGNKPEQEQVQPEQPTKCSDCDNDLTQPFCGVTGKPHVAPSPAASAEVKANGEPFGQFSTDRACTQCGDGMLEDGARQAVFVCIDCDGKFCETCWYHEHKNKKRSHHQQYLLYYECDLCPASGTQQAALWYCDACRLLLCKQCWYNEHKNPSRREHQTQFLYPGGEDGIFRPATIDSQTVECPIAAFDIDQYGAFVKTPSERVCTICSSADGYAAMYQCKECDPLSPELLCEACWNTEHRMPARRGHPKRLLLLPCDVCGDIESRPASVMCSHCQMKLCLNCWDIEHRNPQRAGHTQAPLYNDIDGDTQLLSNVELLAKSLPTARLNEPPQMSPAQTEAVFPHEAAHYGSIMTPDPSAHSSPHYSPSRSDVPQQQYDNFGTPDINMSPQQEADRFYHYRKRLCRFYQVYNPSKLPSVSSCLKEYKGYEEDLMAALVRRYGPEPEPDNEPLPYGWRLVESTRGDLFYIHTDGRKQWQKPVV